MYVNGWCRDFVYSWYIVKIYEGNNTHTSYLNGEPNWAEIWNTTLLDSIYDGSYSLTGIRVNIRNIYVLVATGWATTWQFHAPCLIQLFEDIFGWKRVLCDQTHTHLHFSLRCWWWGTGSCLLLCDSDDGFIEISQLTTYIYNQLNILHSVFWGNCFISWWSED